MRRRGLKPRKPWVGRVPTQGCARKYQEGHRAALIILSAPRKLIQDMKHLWLSAVFFCTFEAFASELTIGSPVPNCPAVFSNPSEKLDLAQYKGKVVLIDFWATWCPPCKKAMPFLNNLHREYSKAGLTVLGINVDEESTQATEYLKTAPVDYAMSFDPQGECPRVFEVKAMPSSYFVDKQGKLRAVHLGFRDTDQEQIRKQVASLLAE